MRNTASAEINAHKDLKYARIIAFEYIQFERDQFEPSFHPYWTRDRNQFLPHFGLLAFWMGRTFFMVLGSYCPGSVLKETQQPSKMKAYNIQQTPVKFSFRVPIKYLVLLSNFIQNPSPKLSTATERKINVIPELNNSL